MRLTGIRILVLAALALCRTMGAFAQDRDRYILGEEKKLEILVHVLGQVQKPGEYRVVDGTSVLELLSKAGGPTEFANLSAVIVTHPRAVEFDGAAGASAGPRVVQVDLRAYLEKQVAPDPPALQPGDVVKVPTNGKYTWKFVSGIMRDLAVVASAYFLGVRAFRD